MYRGAREYGRRQHAAADTENYGEGDFRCVRAKRAEKEGGSHPHAEICQGIPWNRRERVFWCQYAGAID